MKKLIFLILTIGLFTSCANEPIKVDDPKKETTVQIQQLAAIDTICYKVVELDDKVYIIQDQMVVKKIANDSGDRSSFALAFFICLIVLLLILMIKTD